MTATTATELPPASAPAAWAAPRAGRLGVGNVHRELPPIKLLAVQLGNRLLSLLARGHLNEAEAPRPAGELVGDHRSRFDSSALGEELPKALGSGGIGQAANVQFRRHGAPPCAPAFLRGVKLFRSRSRPNTRKKCHRRRGLRGRVYSDPTHQSRQRECTPDPPRTQRIIGSARTATVRARGGFTPNPGSGARTRSCLRRRRSSSRWCPP